MGVTSWQGGAWWVNPALWADQGEGPVARPTERVAVERVLRQAQARRRPLLRVIIALERWYHDRHPEVIPFVRLQLIARRLDMTIYQVDNALQEADRLIEMGRL
jgi:hypothetical protein